MKKADFWIVAVVIALSLLPLPFFLARGAGGAAAVTVTQHGETVYTGLLSEDIVIPLDGAEVVVEHGAVRMRASDCPDRLCVNAGQARQGRPVVCLPNGVVISVTKGEGDAFDAVAY